MNAQPTPELPRQVREALEILHECVRNGFTGALEFDLKDGLPLAVRWRRAARLGKGAVPEPP